MPRSRQISGTNPWGEKISPRNNRDVRIANKDFKQLLSYITAVI